MNIAVVDPTRLLSVSPPPAPRVLVDLDPTAGQIILDIPGVDVRVRAVAAANVALALGARRLRADATVSDLPPAVSVEGTFVHLRALHWRSRLSGATAWALAEDLIRAAGLAATPADWDRLGVTPVRGLPPDVTQLIDRGEIERRLADSTRESTPAVLPFSAYGPGGTAPIPVRAAS